MKCRATSRRTGARCKNTAVTADGACDIESHRKQCAEIASDESFAPGWDNDTPENRAAHAPQLNNNAAELNEAPPGSIEIMETSSAPPDDDELTRMLNALPIGDDTIPAEIASAARGVVDTSVFNEVDDEDAAVVDRAAAAEARKGIVDDIRAKKPVSKKRIARYARMLHNPIFEATGEDPLDDEEADEIADIVYEILEDARGTWVVDSPWARLGTWCAFVYGVRYFDRVMIFAKSMARPKPKIAIAKPAAGPARQDAPTAMPAAEPSLAGVGFA